MKQGELATGDIRLFVEADRIRHPDIGQHLLAGGCQALCAASGQAHHQRLQVPEGPRDCTRCHAKWEMVEVLTGAALGYSRNCVLPLSMLGGTGWLATCCKHLPILSAHLAHRCFILGACQFPQGTHGLCVRVWYTNELLDLLYVRKHYSYPWTWCIVYCIIYNTCITKMSY